MTIVSLDEMGVAIGLDRFGFYVVVDGEPVMGPVRSRQTADELARIWGRRRAADGSAAHAAQQG